MSSEVNNPSAQTQPPPAMVQRWIDQADANIKVAYARKQALLAHIRAVDQQIEMWTGRKALITPMLDTNRWAAEIESKLHVPPPVPTVLESFDHETD